MSSYQHAHEPNAILKNEQPTSMGGDTSKYEMKGGSGYGFDGKEIRAGVMEFSSYKSGGSKKHRRKSSKRRRGFSQETQIGEKETLKCFFYKVIV